MADMDVQLRAYIKSTKVQLVVPKNGTPYIEGILTLRFPVDDTKDLGVLADMQSAGEVVAEIQSVQFAMPGVRRAVENLVDDLADAGIGSVTVEANGKTATVNTKRRKPAETPA